MTSVCKILQRAFLTALFLATTTATFAQIRYVQTGYIDREGIRQPANSNLGSSVIKISFSGQYITVSSGQFNFKYKYHHSQGENAIYYRSANDMLSGREFLNENDINLISSDRQLVNSIFYQDGNRLWTIIYEQRDEDYGTMAR